MPITTAPPLSLSPICAFTVPGAADHDVGIVVADDAAVAVGPLWSPHDVGAGVVYLDSPAAGSSPVSG
ncbi:hypothetical protein [Microlunatus soli]|uniref:Uncharacterized protein n=1 Tax=Microlunatus soli TaxID=630515 RepID=A0A1H1NYM5_9ACTN|nr:hypothetical protein [Microlunatus soli]SDS04044.1 hypothetical protein SAMN04489812_0698 [Microlunatus soli]